MEQFTALKNKIPINPVSILFTFSFKLQVLTDKGCWDGWSVKKLENVIRKRKERKCAEKEANTSNYF